MVNIYQLLGINIDDDAKTIQLAISIHQKAKTLPEKAIEAAKQWLLVPDVRQRYNQKLQQEHPELFTQIAINKEIPQGAKLVCDKCSTPIRSGSKFCPNCGDPVDYRDIASENEVSSGENESDVVITFGYSSSASYDRAVAICENMPSYSVAGDGNKTVHKLSIPLSEIDLIVNLYEIIGNWKTSTFHIGHKQITKRDLTMGALGCYRKYCNSYNKEEYCANNSEYYNHIFGCNRLDMPIQVWGGGWLEYGQFDVFGKWIFDKPRIQKELQDGLLENELCPRLDRQAVMKIFTALPNSISPNTDPNWEYKYQYDYNNETYQSTQRMVGIKPAEKK
ncbi:zinc ribbon domain-containing protein [Vitreoscilla massiliensis]|uniref:Zinc ribbon domain-containing protein n=1 Tax=Vitreoscilla massiliensis TaxID=1689272 RepID=A0ABY4E130_9NEIS|nr:zinc ribbon domain-containing protein [Vitreoscilla massiliensis]UOO89498.1 zinc ribbon domain-containing protein [Vitreoscilla massiliensis]